MILQLKIWKKAVGLSQNPVKPQLEGAWVPEDPMDQSLP